MSAILVLIMFTICITADYLIHRKRNTVPDVESITDTIPTLNFQDFDYPKGLFYHTGHTWCYLQLQGNVLIGLDDFIQKLIGPIDKIIAPEIGTQLMKGDQFLILIVGNRSFKIVAPVSGIVYRVNESILANYHIPFTGYPTDYWLVDLQTIQLAEELDKLLLSTKTVHWITQEINRIKEFLFNHDFRYELAEKSINYYHKPIVGVLKLLDEAGWKDFQRDFLFDSSEK